MSSPQFEAFLARLYGDPEFSEQFLANPAEAMRDIRLDERERLAMLAIDPLELRLASQSYAAKRRNHSQPRIGRLIGLAIRKIRR